VTCLSDPVIHPIATAEGSQLWPAPYLLALVWLLPWIRILCPISLLVGVGVSALCTVGLLLLGICAVLLAVCALCVVGPLLLLLLLGVRTVLLGLLASILRLTVRLVLTLLTVRLLAMGTRLVAGWLAHQLLACDSDRRMYCELGDNDSNHNAFEC
jgi:hypothetical protein